MANANGIAVRGLLTDQGEGEEVTMLKTELVDRLAAKAGIGPAAAERMLEAVLGSFVDALWDDDRLRIPGFGIFYARLNFEGKRRINFNPDKRLKGRD